MPGISDTVSGMSTSSAPPAKAHSSAMAPDRRPITSITNKRSWEAAVSRMRSMASNAVLAAVSNPMEKSVPVMSLSMLAGTPMVGSCHVLANSCAPRKDPSPPITTTPSMPCFFRLETAFFCPSFVLNASLRADSRIVPPRSMIPPTELKLISRISSRMIPSNPRWMPTTDKP